MFPSTYEKTDKQYKITQQLVELGSLASKLELLTIITITDAEIRECRARYQE